MVTLAAAKELALSLPEAIEAPHFHLTSFRVNKKIFATLHEDKHLVMVKLPLAEQSVFCAFDETVIYPVPGGWGRQGSTFVNLKKVRKAMLKDALTVAWKGVAGKKLVEKYYGTT